MLDALVPVTCPVCGKGAEVRVARPSNRALLVYHSCKGLDGDGLDAMERDAIQKLTTAKETRRA